MSGLGVEAYPSGSSLNKKSQRVKLALKI